MQLLDGKALADKIAANLKARISQMEVKPKLGIIIVGQDPSSLKYIDLKTKRAQEIGVEVEVHRLDENVEEREIKATIDELSHNRSISGFFIQLPMPAKFNQEKILEYFPPFKDVDCISGTYFQNHFYQYQSGEFLPAVVSAISKILESYQITVRGKHAVIINDSQLIGLPLFFYLRHLGATCTLCNHKTADLKTITQTADILISATGSKNLITSDMVREGSVVVDVSNGDVDFANVKDKTSFITPTFGSIGPMTIVCLLENLVENHARLFKYRLDPEWFLD